MNQKSELRQRRDDLRRALDDYRTLRRWVSDANKGRRAPMARGQLLNMCRLAKQELRAACAEAHLAVWRHRAQACSLLRHQAD